MCEVEMMIEVVKDAAAFYSECWLASVYMGCIMLTDILQVRK